MSSRYIDNGEQNGGFHPRMHYYSTTNRFWPLDNDNSTDCNGYHGASTTANNLRTMNSAAPSIVSAHIGNGRRYGTGAHRANGSSSIAAKIAAGNYTFSGWVRIRGYAPSSNRDAIFGYWGNNALTTAAESGLFLLAVKDDGELSYIWENSGATANGGWRDTGVTLERWNWYKIDCVAVPNASNLDFSIYINGQKVYESTGLVRAAGGTSSHFVVGAINSGGSNILTANVDLAGFYFWDTSLSDAELVDDFKRGFRIGYQTSKGVRASIEDQSVSELFFNSIIGDDYLLGVEMSDDVDTTTQQAELKIVRDVDRKSMSPLRTDSAVNLTDKLDPTSFEELIRKGREIKIYSYEMPFGMSPQSTDLMHIFEGEILGSDFTGDEMSVVCADKTIQIVQAFIENNYNYGGPYKTEDGGLISPIVPVAIETVMQEILDDNDNTTGTNPAVYGSYSPFTLYTPEDPSYGLLEYEQRREPVMSALLTLASQIGWTVRWLWSNEHSEFRLTLKNPDPGNVPYGLAFNARDTLSVSSASIRSENVRNSIKILYPSSEDYASGTPPDINVDLPAAGYAIPSGYVATNDNSGPDTHGNRTPAYITMEDRDSIDKYGRMHSEIVEDITSQLDTVVEAGRLALAFLGSMAEPQIDYAFEVPFCPYVVPGDKLLIVGDKELFTADQELRVVGVSHSFTDGAGVTSISTRGTPSYGFKKWLKLEARPGIGEPGTALGGESTRDRRRGDLIASQRDAFENSDQFTGGKYLNVRNQDFQLMTRGDRYEPDGWSSNNWWNYATSALSIWPSTVNTLSGTQAIHFGALTSPTQTDSGIRRGLKSDLIPIKGGTTPYSFECAWIYTTGGATNMGVDLLIEWYGGDKVTLLGTTQIGGSSPSFPDRVGVNNWQRGRVDGISPVSTSARFIRILIGCAFGASTSCYVDSVTGYQTSLAAQAARTSSASNNSVSIYPIIYPAGEECLVHLDEDETPFTVGSNDVDVFDYGEIAEGAWLPVAGSSGSYGWRFLIKEDGTYDIFAEQVLLVAPADVDDVTLKIIKNGTYTYNTGGLTQRYNYNNDGSMIGIDGGTLTATSVGNGNNQYQFSARASSYLEQGDWITVNVDNASAIAVDAGNTGDDAINYVSIKLRRAD